LVHWESFDVLHTPALLLAMDRADASHSPTMVEMGRSQAWGNGTFAPLKGAACVARFVHPMHNLDAMAEWSAGTVDNCSDKLEVAARVLAAITESDHAIIRAPAVAAALRTGS
jgi:hypothetical protein